MRVWICELAFIIYPVTFVLTPAFLSYRICKRLELRKQIKMVLCLKKLKKYMCGCVTITIFWETPSDLGFTNSHLSYPHISVSYSRPDFRKEISSFFLTTISLMLMTQHYF